ncbi:MAG: M20/M25/M40 family metallo-hydrolase [Candidatus Micrarchaeaceae archaeon]
MDTVKLLGELVGFKSIAPYELEIGRYLEKSMAAMGFATSVQKVEENRYNILAEKGSGPAILLYGHMDVVEVGEGWLHDPFKLFVEGDIAYGRGVHDMKGGIVSIMEAVEGIEPKGIKIKVAFGVDEEQISKGSNALINSGWLNDVKFAIVPESNATKKFSGNPGLPLVVLGRRGRVPIEVTVHGKAAHAASPEQGRNAIEGMARLLASLGEIRLAENAKLGKGSICTLSVSGKAESLTVPDACTAVIDRHYVPPETEGQVVAQVKELAEIKGIDAEVKPVKRETPFLMPYITDENNEYVKRLSSLIIKSYGRIEYGYGLSVADENAFGARLGMPVAVIGPKGGNAHSANEWASISSIEETAKLFRSFLDSF